MTKTEKNKIEAHFLGNLIESLQVIQTSLENDVDGCWLLDGGVGYYLEDMAKTYRIIVDNVEVDFVQDRNKKHGKI